MTASPPAVGAYSCQAWTLRPTRRGTGGGRLLPRDTGQLDRPGYRGAGGAQLPGCQARMSGSPLRRRSTPETHSCLTACPGRGRPSPERITSPSLESSKQGNCRSAWRSPPTPSHGGSQGFKPLTSTPSKALHTGLAGRPRRAGAVPDPPTGQQTGSNRQRNGRRTVISERPVQRSS